MALRPDDARWVYGLNDEHVHKARPHAERALCGVFVGRDFEGEKPTPEQHANCGCIALDLDERGEIRIVRRGRVNLPQI